MPEILTSLKRAVVPEITDTQERAQPKRLTMRVTSSAVALPSTGGDRRRATHTSSLPGSSTLTREQGLAWTLMTNESLARRVITDLSADLAIQSQSAQASVWSRGAHRESRQLALGRQAAIPAYDLFPAAQAASMLVQRRVRVEARLALTTHHVPLRR